MKNIKFELTENSIKWKGYTLYQIKACKAFTTNGGVSVSEGELGGWIEKEENLSQEGSAWIWDEVKVCGTARVAGNAEIFGNAAIKGNAKVYGNAKIYGDAEIWGDSEISGDSKISGDAKIGGDAFISSPDNIITIAPIGKYKVSLTVFRTKNNSIKVSYNWDIYTLEKFQSVMNDWTEKEQKIVKAAIEILGGNE